MTIHQLDSKLIRRKSGAQIARVALLLLLAVLPGAGNLQAAPAAAPYDRSPNSFQVPEFSPGLHWFNVKSPLTMKELRGKMVLLDFWTYGCINCMHILPELKELQTHFGNGLVIVGVHSPKFANEKNDAGVREAVLRYKIDHPVVSDSQMSLWHTLGVNAWPTVLLIDPDGYVTAGVAGEGVSRRLLPLMEKVAAGYRATGKLDDRPLGLVMESSHEPPSTLAFPGKILADGAGKRLFIADSGHDRILVTSLDGAVQEVIGSGKEGRADGSYAAASFSTPQGMALVGDRLYVADTNNHLLRAVDLRGRRVTTVAGTGKQAQQDEPGAAPLQRALSSPWDLDWVKGQLYIAMAGNHQIWRYDPAQDRIDVFAGSGEEARKDGSLTTASFAQPSGLADDGSSLFVADSESSSIRRIDLAKGQVTTLAGGNLFDFGHRDGVGLAARFQHPLGLSYANGTLYIADTYNSDIRTLDPATGRAGTLAGANLAGNADGKTARFYEPGGLAFLNGALYVADTDNGIIRVVDPGTRSTSTLAITIHFVPGTGGEPAATSSAETGISGTVFIGPVSPVSRAGDPNHRPYSTDLQAVRADGAVAATTHSAANGTFTIALPAGQYTLKGSPGKGKFYPRSPSQSVTVTDHQLTHVDLEFDSGIR